MPSQPAVPQQDEEAVRTVLARAVSAIGGEPRPGQVQMAEAVAAALTSGEHLLVQAGTGTGKSLAYLVPALLHGSRVVVATATLALQHQLVERDLPRLWEAVKQAPEVPADASYAVLKGRANYACLHRVREGAPDDQGVLVEVPAGALGAEVVTLRGWAEAETATGGSGDRDAAPRHTDRAWRQVSVSHRECLGATRCPYGGECFAEQARERAHLARLVVTNHSLLAIDAIQGVPMIPEYDAVVVDEAHELTARITQAATGELTAAEVERAARRAQRHVEGEEGDDLGRAADALRLALEAARPGRLDVLPEGLALALAGVRDSARGVVSALGSGGEAGGDGDAARVQARGAAQDVFANAARMAVNADADVLWVGERERGGSVLCVAPLNVAGPIRDRLLRQKKVVFTSATLRLGGDFTAVAGSLGLRAVDEAGQGPPAETDGAAGPSPDGPRAGDGEQADDVVRWRGLDVGSPFDYRRQAILYIARHLPAPGRDGLGEQQLAEIVALVEAAGGRTLGLFSSRRAAQTAAEVVRERLPELTTLAQGDAQLPELARQFGEDPHTSLFGTLGLWQGLDVPGDTCQLVLIDRIPFPRPDDPLMSARQRAADAAGRNGFMQVSATHAALLLAQGAGRLIRTATDRGVVAVLDPRLATARYGPFLRASLPPMWPTTDREVVRAALRRLAGSAAGAPRRR